MQSTQQDETNILALVVALAAAVAMLIGLVVLRATTNKNWEVRFTDAAIAIIPIIVWLILAGRLKEFKLGSEGFTAAFQEAVAAPIQASIERLPIQNLLADEKSGLPDLQKMIEKKDQALIFVLGKRYDPSIAKEYLQRLTQEVFFKFIEIQDNVGGLFGLLDARLLMGYLKTDGDWSNFISAVQGINQPYLTALPSFVGRSAAVTEMSEKSDVLKKMEDSQADWLPVTGPDGKLIGVVERSAVLARLVLDLNARLRQ